MFEKLQRLSAILGSLVFFCLLTASAIADEPRRPNVIYILADDLGYGDLGCYGQTKIETPHIDRLAKNGMRFTQHYSGSTVCAPSRCSLMTGLHTGHAVVRGNSEVKPEGQTPMPADTFTLAKHLQSGGYVTGLFGKWGLGAPGSQSEPLSMGFDRFYGYNCQRMAHCYYPAFLWDNNERELLWGNVGSVPEQYAPDLIHQEALKFIRDNKDQPFFMFYAAVQPHADMIAPEEFMEKYRGKFLPESVYEQDYYIGQPEGHAAFAAMVNILDNYVGDLVNELEKQGLADDTLIIFTSDNGPHREGGHDPKYFDSNGELRGIKRDLFEGGVRVPMIASWPGHIQASSESDYVSAFWDVMPTLAELTGHPLPVDVDGISMLPTLLGKPEQQKQHEYLYWEIPLSDGRVAIRKGNWKAIRYEATKGTSKLKLFDLDNDLGETRNVAAQHPDVVAELNELINQVRNQSPIRKFNFKIQGSDL